MSQSGGTLGYGLRDHPVILGKLLGQPADRAGDYVQTALLELATEIVSAAQNEDETLTTVFVQQVLAEEGLQLEPNAKWIDKKVQDPSVIWMVTQVFFGRGAGVGFHFPNEFQTYWANTFRPRPPEEWDEMYRLGVVTTPRQAVMVLEDEVCNVLVLLC